ncbi:MAG: flagellar M-ring protein FliF [Rhodobacteraceae bacterium]|nr:flagellar M-ring protein FliF [Paracoccaceae bacterium]MCF8513419.1 flagellar M-ring protein FliF [Paracoccaceae bacterium]MCF8517681.1 flagellar M-ring protein FliF [Paracoccaceae bacterium]
MVMTPNTPVGTRSGTALVSRAQGVLAQLGGVTHQPSVRRAMPAIVIVAVTGLALALWLLASEAPKRPLFPGLAESEKSRVIEALSTAGIPAEIDTITGEVVVARGDYYRSRMALATAGLPQATPGGDAVLSDMPMGTSRSVEAAKLRQAMEVDLARSIMEIADVTGARIHLALPEKSAFLRETAPPRASVFLQVARGRVIAPGQVEAIVNLVASAIPGMARQDVTVIDQTGRLLSRGGDDPGSLINDRQMQQRIEVENLYRQRIESLLTPIAGPGNLSVQVTVDMDFTRSEIKAERVDPNGTALRSEQEQSQETSEGIARGIPGAVSNTPPAESALTDQGPAAAADRGSRNRSSGSTKNYEISRTVETTVPGSAKVMRINAAVVLRDTMIPPVEEGGAPTTSIAPELLADMERLAQTAIGFDAARGDSVTVLARPFLDDLGLPEESIFAAPWLPDAMRQLGMIVALGIIAFGIVRPILLKVLFPGEGRIGVGGEIEDEVEVQDGESLDQVRARLKERQGALQKNMLDAAKSHEEQILVIRKLVDEDSGRIATTFRQMIAAELDTIS